eukprot:TRINITY_DN6938_c0_g1_i1.p1 TRINITY_DN6938_c0_g1~~TRINITY_DN6938_c0_g1_i1.p1  ORF type:complete len:924 (+),score=203.48 TRINITY_DN6938_c0_g1_i1:65-2836(+)
MDTIQSAWRFVQLFSAKRFNLVDYEIKPNDLIQIGDYLAIGDSEGHITFYNRAIINVKTISTSEQIFKIFYEPFYYLKETKEHFFYVFCNSDGQNFLKCYSFSNIQSIRLIGVLTFSNDVMITHLTVHRNFKYITFGYNNSTINILSGNILSLSLEKIPFVSPIDNAEMSLPIEGEIKGLVFHPNTFLLAVVRTKMIILVTFHPKFSFLTYESTQQGVLWYPEENSNPLLVASSQFNDGDAGFSVHCQNSYNYFFYWNDAMKTCFMPRCVYETKTLDRLGYILNGVNIGIYSVKRKNSLFHIFYSASNFDLKFLGFQTTFNQPILMMTSFFDSFILMFEMEDGKYVFEKISPVSASQKIDNFCKRGYFQEALRYIDSIEMEKLDNRNNNNSMLDINVKELRTAVKHQYAQYLLSNKKYELAMNEYLSIIDDISSSLVVKAFLEVAEFEQLLRFLRVVWSHGLATFDHVTLLLTCCVKLNNYEEMKKYLHEFGSIDECGLLERYSAGEKIELLKKIIATSDDDATINIVFEQSCALALNNELHEEYIGLLLLHSDSESIEKALNYLVHEAETSPTTVIRVFQDSQCYRLIEYRPQAMLDLVLKLPIFHKDNMDQLIYISHLFTTYPFSLYRFVAFAEKEMGFLPAPLMTILCEASFRYLKTLGDKDDAVENFRGRKWDVDKMDLNSIRLLALSYDRPDILTSIDTTTSDPMAYLSSGKPTETHTVLHMTRALTHQRPISLGSNINQEMIMLLTILDDMIGYENKNNDLFVRFLEEVEIEPILLLLKRFVDNENTQLGHVKSFLQSFLIEETKQTELLKTNVEELKEKIANLENELAELEMPQSFQKSICSKCGKELTIPTIHFLCGHSFHQETCYEKGPCPICHESDGIDLPDIRTFTEADILKELDSNDKESLANLIAQGVFQ